MKKLVSIGLILISVASFAKNGLGIKLGSDTGPTFITGTGWQFDLGLTHTPSFAVSKKINISKPFYFAPGVKIKADKNHNDYHDHNHDGGVGVRVSLGANHFINREVEILAELTPTVYFIDHSQFRVEGNVGIRYWF